jgi:hypothetical protein
MRRMLKNQNGITGIGIVFILAVIGGVVLIGLRLFPLYNEKFQIVSALNNVVTRPEASSFTSKQAHKSFMNSIAVTNIDRFTMKNLKDHMVVLKPKKKGDPRMLHMRYESRNKFFADIEFVLVYDKKLPMTGLSTGE